MSRQLPAAGTAIAAAALGFCCGGPLLALATLVAGAVLVRASSRCSR